MALQTPDPSPEDFHEADIIRQAPPPITTRVRLNYLAQHGWRKLKILNWRFWTPEYKDDPLYQLLLQAYQLGRRDEYVLMHCASPPEINKSHELEDRDVLEDRKP